MKIIAALIWFGTLHLSGAANLDLLTLVAGPANFKISGAAAGDQQGYFVSNAGDVNHDEYDDIVVSSNLNQEQMPALHT